VGSARVLSDATGPQPTKTASSLIRLTFEQGKYLVVVKFEIVGLLDAADQKAA
jgi:hypothetical protein